MVPRRSESAPASWSSSGASSAMRARVRRSVGPEMLSAALAIYGGTFSPLVEVTIEGFAPAAPLAPTA